MRNITAIIHRCSLLSTSLALLTITAPAQVDLGTVQVSTVGHGTFYDMLLGITQVNDYLVPNGGASLPSLSANFDLNNQFVLTISAPPGERFLVQSPAGRTVSLLGRLQWDGPNPTGASSAGTLTMSFGNPIGTPPTPDPASSSYLASNHGFFGFNNIQSTGFTAPFSFSSMTLMATVPSANTGLGTLSYSPDASSGLAFAYAQPGTGDPGSFVSIVPEPSVLRLMMLVGVALLVGLGCKHQWQRTSERACDASVKSVGAGTASSDGLVPVAQYAGDRRGRGRPRSDSLP
jgi:hypothetical protein